MGPQHGAVPAGASGQSGLRRLLYNMAFLHLDMNHLNESRKLLKQLLESNPDDREAAEKLKEISIDTKGDSS